MLRSAVVASILFSAACLTNGVTDESLSTTEQLAATVPWKQAAKWPYRLSGSRMYVHYQAAGDLAMAQTVLADIEDAWTKQMTQGGSRIPLDDGGLAGPDGRFDVYLQRGLNSLYVDAVATNDATTWDDYSTAMVLDPWGQYGGVEMRPNVFHELRHASQAVDDWWEHAFLFEAEATAWETAYYGYDRIDYVWTDYQAHPEWMPFKNDRYVTWYMYGGAMFFLWLRQNVFANSLAFTNDMWLASRNPAGTNEPDFCDALEPLLAARGTSLFAQVTSFARARWYTGSRANGTLDGGASIAEVATKSHARASGAARTSFIPGPEVLGTVYTVVTAAPTDGATLRVSLSNIAAGMKPVVQVVGQGAGDRVLDLSTGSATVSVVGGKVVLAVTMQPANGQFDPDTVGTQLYKATVNIDKI
ncbi:MAG TPA: hypothetical protein VNO30_45635 [Kofleriaceae bacterium]|nr:hypothetical protein [Kofleriaceae bacterium]